MTEQEIEIIPIFEQNKAVWKDFTEVEAKVANGICSDYYYSKDQRDLSEMLYRENYKIHYNSFAFGAYNTNKYMFGFVNGFVDKCQAIVTNILVMPGFRQKGIGSDLLRSVERVALLNGASFIKVLENRRYLMIHGCYDFYNKHGYKFSESGNFFKDIKSVMQSGVTPFFGPTTPEVQNHCKKIAMPQEPYDIFYSNNRNPLMIFLSNGRPIGFITARMFQDLGIALVNDLHVSKNYLGTGVDCELMNSMNKFARHRDIKNTKTYLIENPKIKFYREQMLVKAI